MVATVTEHYENHLAPVYLWMAGGFESAVSRGEGELNAVLPSAASGLTAVDLGAGFGMHAIPLARRGGAVVAIDSSRQLLETLRTHAGTLPIRAVEDDLLGFQKYLDTKAHLILCMGDTLTHLPDKSSVEQLFSHAAGSLHPGGAFIATFRDYTAPLAETARFIPVRSDGDRILTCFLEYSPDHVTVHDLLHERTGPEWRLRASAYKKLRLAPDWVIAALQERGFTTRAEPGLAGMVRIIAAW